MKKSFYGVIAIATIASASVTAQAQNKANHLIFSEVGVKPPNQANDASSEYVEIFNPTDEVVSLDKYYLTDKNVYADLPIAATGLLSGATTDHILRFPAGYSLQPGQVLVVCGGANNFLTDFYGGDKANYDVLPNAPLLFEVGQTNPSVPDMISLNNSTTRPLNYNLTDPGPDNGEYSVLFYWDGLSKAVKDVDIVGWGLAQLNPANIVNAFEPKTPPYYLQDAGTQANLSVTTNAKVLIRTTDVEQDEVTTGGNGLTGHDESTEAIPPSWISVPLLSTGDISGMTPGVTSMTLTNNNVPPLINSLTRDKQFPTPTDQVKITVNVTDPDGTVASVIIYVAQGSGAFTPVTATAVGSDYSVTVGPYPDNSVIRYYVVATDEDGSVTTFPVSGATAPRTFTVDDAAPTSNDIVINEILYDRIGTDTDEWFELYNRRSTPEFLGNLRVQDNSGVTFVFPDDAVIPGNGFVVLTFRATTLASDYVLPVGLSVYQYSFSLDNGTDTITIYHPNTVDFYGLFTTLDQVTYQNVANWPVITGNTSGRSIELKSPELDNNDPLNWVGSPPAFNGDSSPKMGGSPGKANSTISAVSNWTLF